jgi:hypothetical protein
MNLLVYIPGNDEPEKRLQKMLLKIVDWDNLKIFRTFQELVSGLHLSLDPTKIVLLLASTIQDLKDLLYIQDLLTPFWLILIIPDRKKATTAKGHLLRPRFLSYRDSNFLDVALVLQKKIKHFKEKKNMEENDEKKFGV